MIATDLNYLYHLKDTDLEAIMKQFTFSDLSRRSGDVLDAAMAGRVSLAKRGKAKVMMMPMEEYERLERLAAARRERHAFTLADAPKEDIENLSAGFRQILDDADTGE